MDSKTNDTLNTMKHWYSFQPMIVFEGIIIGVFSGLVVVLYRFLLAKASSLTKLFIKLYGSKPSAVVLLFALLIIFSIIIGYMVKAQPMIGGSGIPQVEGVLSGKLHMNWWKVILGKLISGVLCIGSGLSLGREGPSIQLGASVGLGFGKVFKRPKVEERYLITSGASAGLAAAFNAPLAGVMFSMEEIHKSFSPLILLSAMSAAVTSDYVSKLFFGMNPIFAFGHLDPLPLYDYLFLVVLGFMLGFLGAAFNSVLLKTQDLYKSQKWLPLELRPLIPFIISGILMFILPQVLGGGNELITLLSKETFGLRVLVVLLIVKFLFTMICYGSGSPGGIFLPLLSIGALIGCIYGTVLSKMFGLNINYVNNFIIISMAGYFTAVVRAPLTGIILITEMTGSFEHLLSLTIVSVIAYVTAEALNSKPVYEALLDRLIGQDDICEPPNGSEMKTVLEIPVCPDAILDGCRVKDIKWPKNCLLVGIRRGDTEIIPKGNTVIMSGDCLIALSNEKDSVQLKQTLEELAGRAVKLNETQLNK